MKKIVLGIVLLGIFSSLCFAHLCNDVFIQAQDNLAVKVDIRDGQLRITDKGSFNVYLLNTMDRRIVNIQLEVLTDQFDVQVKSDPKWKSFPLLEAKRNGGKKECFNVTLTRKKGVKEGKYNIKLHLFNGQNKSMVFKTVEISDALSTVKLPVAKKITMDGNVTKGEWNDAYLCSSFYEYKKKSSERRAYLENVTSSVETRARFVSDKDNLYCALDFQKSGKKDVAKIYIAKDHESDPKVITVDLQAKTATTEDGTKITCAFKDLKVELKIPLKDVDLLGESSFYVNVTRKKDDTQTYWRGNSYSEKEPVVYANFICKE